MRIIDMHAHLWLRGKEEDCKYKIMRSIEHYGIDKVFVSSLNSAHPDEEETEALNLATYNFMREEPRHIRGYVNVNHTLKNAKDVLRRGIEEMGMIGVKIWVPAKCDIPEMYPIAEATAEYGVPMLIHATTKSNKSTLTTESTSVNVRNLAIRYPELKIIMAHIDGNCYRGAENVRDLKNVYVDFSGGTGRCGEVEYAVQHIGADRILFGTDLSACSFAVPYARLLEAKITEREREMILSENTERLFGKI